MKFIPPQVTVPSDKSKKVLEFCKQISGVKPFYVDVRPDEKSDSSNCHYNVKNYKEINSGDIVFGWIILQHSKIMLEAQFHSVWKSPQGIYVDITPDEMNSKRILFLPDLRNSYDFCDNKRLCNRWYPLTDHNDFQELVNVLRQRHELIERYPGIGDIELTEEDTKEHERLDAAMTIFMLKILEYETRKRKRRKPLK